MFCNKCRQIHSIESFHHVVERPVVGLAKVIDADGVRRLQSSRRLGFSLETTLPTLGHFKVIRANQFDCGRASQHLVRSLVDGPHSTFAELVAQAVLAKL